jgi:tyrosyl-tRNA synthetase
MAALRVKPLPPRQSQAMTAPTSDFLRVLTERGFIHQTSDLAGIDALAREGGLTTYVGYDCTAASLHIGHLVSIMMLHWLQETAAGRPIVLMGGGTTRVGDPSGRDETRKILTIEQIDENKAGIRRTFDRFLRFGEGRHDAAMSDNAEWLTGLNYIEFLRDVGRHFSVNRMLSMDSVRMRLEREHELSFIEFNYMLLQSYDFVELNRRYGCRMQMGGSDQWGNIVNGIDLGRRMGAPQLYALTAPLMTTASGAKMGKTAAGAVWLAADLRSPYEYWQFWRNTEDADVGRFLRLFTALPMDEIARLAALAGAEINEAKKVLATEATALLHGREAADGAAETATMTFEQGVLSESLPTIEHPRAAIEAGLAIGPAIILAGLAASNGEVRRAIANGAISVNDTKVTDEKRIVSAADLSGGVVKLSFGRKKHVLLRAV